MDRSRPPKKNYFIIVIAIISIVSIPAIYFIVENGFNYNLSASDWLGFFGGYSGALLGTLGILLSIAHSNSLAADERAFSIKQFEEDKRLSKMPNFLPLVIDTGAAVIESYYYSQDKYEDIYFTYFFSLNNFGDGMAVDFHIISLNVNGYDTMHNNFRKTTTCVKPNDAIHFRVEFEKNDMNQPYTFVFEVEYSDMYEYTYTQVINVECEISKNNDGSINIENKHLNHNFPQKGSRS
jgi:hypothetical protein